MIKLTDEDLRKIKAIQLDIMESIDQVCQSESLNYTLAYGTLLGAVRHQGYIPWDDDIDILMPREDYEKFLELAEAKLPDKFYIVHYKNCEQYGLPFAKIMANNTVMREISVVNANVPCGVFVDIFPLDASPKAERLKRKQHARAVSMQRALLCKANYFFGQTGLRLLVYRLRKIACLAYPRKKLVRDFERNAKRYQHDLSCTEYVCLCVNDRLEAETFAKEDFSSYITMDFEGHSFKTIAAYDKHLRTIYGDYMKLPPAEERVPHHYVAELSLDND